MDIVSLDLSDAEMATEFLALHEVEAALISSHDIPPLDETLDELQSSGEIGALVERRIVGAVSYRLVDTIDLHRLVVDPTRFRDGIGTTLVRAALAAEPSATRAIVQAGFDNEPAKALYLREGFGQTDELEGRPGFVLLVSASDSGDLPRAEK